MVVGSSPVRSAIKNLTFNELGAFSFHISAKKKTLIAKGPFFVFFINLNFISLAPERLQLRPLHQKIGLHQ